MGFEDCNVCCDNCGRTYLITSMKYRTSVASCETCQEDFDKKIKTMMESIVKVKL